MAKPTKLTTIEISRKRWLRGKGNGELRNSSGQQCCLGFVCRVAGFKAKEIVNHSYPNQLFRGADLVPELLKPLVTPHKNGYQTHTGITFALANVNDDRQMPLVERERKLKQLAKEAGYRFVFVD